jgi:hypothetical protein
MDVMGTFLRVLALLHWARCRKLAGGRSDARIRAGHYPFLTDLGPDEGLLE